MQSGSRRLSARLQGKDDTQSKSISTYGGGAAPKDAVKNQTISQTRSKKRRNDYDEDDDGFAFSRVNKKKKRRQSKDDSTPHLDTGAGTVAPVASIKALPPRTAVRNAAPSPLEHDDEEVMELPKKRRKKMSFSTPKTKETQPVRRSKRLSSEVPQPEGSPLSAVTATEVKSRKKTKHRATESEIDQPVEQNRREETENETSQQQEHVRLPESTHEATRIALPFADTPVIRRNKAMREGKSMKGDRRSSLGLRGRRASSLIDSGTSNALPHQEVEAVEFFKHIESDLMEPRRMRQLLTWCATRAMHAKPKGTGFEDASAKSAARIIEEELLKELTNKSELSDWFSREDVAQPPEPLPEKPNPKNLQNLHKITELETQINRLKTERDALQTLLHPPKIFEVHDSDVESNTLTNIDRTLLSEEDAALLDALQDSLRLPENVSRRINDISSSIGPSIDRFADNVHRVAQYRTAADNVAGKVLSICADRLSSREKAGRRKALHMEEDRSPGRDLSNVLRGLSKADR